MEVSCDGGVVAGVVGGSAQVVVCRNHCHVCIVGPGNWEI